MAFSLINRYLGIIIHLNQWFPTCVSSIKFGLRVYNRVYGAIDSGKNSLGLTYIDIFVF